MHRLSSIEISALRQFSPLSVKRSLSAQDYWAWYRPVQEAIVSTVGDSFVPRKHAAMSLLSWQNVRRAQQQLPREERKTEGEISRIIHNSMPAGSRKQATGIPRWTTPLGNEANRHLGVAIASSQIEMETDRIQIAIEQALGGISLAGQGVGLHLSFGRFDGMPQAPREAIDIVNSMPPDDDLTFDPIHIIRNRKLPAAPPR